MFGFLVPASRYWLIQPPTLADEQRAAEQAN